MLGNYIKTALRNIKRNKTYAVINIFGLALGLTIYIFGGLFAEYEYSHDDFFENHDRIYSIGSVFTPEIDVGVGQLDGTLPAVTPIIKTELPEIEAVARTFYKEFLFTIDNTHYYQKLRFADPELFNIFDFEFIAGDHSALNSTTRLIITESMAHKYFAAQNPIGKTITLDHENDFTIAAIIRDLPANTHFNSVFIENVPFEFVAPMAIMERMTGISPDEDWDNFSPSNLTYILLPEHLDQIWLQNQINGIYERHFDEKSKKLFASLFVIPIIEVNTSIWNAIGIPAIDVIEWLGILVLIITCVNYTNLATAQSMKRAREVGLRKTLGAGPVQLLSQFIVESIMVTLIAMVIAVSILEFIIPIFNATTGKALSINYLTTIPWLIMTLMIVGILSGSYPAYLITKTNPIEVLRDSGLKGHASTWIRGLMIGIQFTISVFILALVLVIYSQNAKVVESSKVFPKDKIYTLDRVGVEPLTERHELLRNEISNIRGVENFSLSSHVPYHLTGRDLVEVSRIIDSFTASIAINKLSIDQQYLKTYSMPLVAGRALLTSIALDTEKAGRKTVNVLVNELAAQNLGFVTPENAIGKSFYGNGNGLMTYKIVGVVGNQNYEGFQNRINPYVMIMNPLGYNLASIKLFDAADAQTIKDIEAVWKRLIPDFPMQGRLLEDIFQDNFVKFKIASTALSVFAFFALVLALIGLYGLAAYMAEQRTKEIGVRKVYGASSPQILELLIWQFSKPVIWATPFALGFAYLASDFYLGLFEERIGLPYAALVIAGLIALILSWITVATHAYKVARTNPVNALHYE